MHLTKQKLNGAVLFTGLIVLLVLSLLAVTSMQGSTLEERMAANTKDEIIAFEAAEAALAAGEALLDSGTLTLTNFKVDETDGYYENTSDKLWDEIDWQTEAVNVSFSPASVTTPPKFIIQHLGETTDITTSQDLGGESYAEATTAATAEVVQIFRVVARGTGTSDNSVVFLQSVYGAEW